MLSASNDTSQALPVPGPGSPAAASGRGNAEPTPSALAKAEQQRPFRPRFSFLAHMLEVLRGADKEAELLQDRHTWLHELTPLNDNEQAIEASFAESRQAFREDGNFFVITLRRFIIAERRMEFFFSFIDDKIHGAYAQHLLHLLHEIYLQGSSRGTTSITATSNDITQMKVTAKDTKIPDSEMVHYKWAMEMAKNRRNLSKPTKLQFDIFEKNEESLTQSLREAFPEVVDNFYSFKGWLAWSDKRYWKLKSVSDICFNCDDMDNSWVSPRWLQIGTNLHKLAQLEGAKVLENYNPYDEGCPNIIQSLSDEVQGHGIVRDLQTYIQDQRITIQQQEQVIAALRFRHLMEQLSSQEAGNSATQKWVKFWETAVDRVWDERRPPDHDGPVVKLLETHFARARKNAQKNAQKSTQKTTQQKQQEAEKTMELLQQKNSTSFRARALYGVLSEVIHKYQDGQFKLNPLTYSPDDINILQALAPLPVNISAGTVDWEEERKRYMLSHLTAQDGYCDACWNERPLVQQIAKSQQAAFPKLGGMDTYIVGDDSCAKGVIIVFDIFGHTDQAITGAQTLAKDSRYKVFMPDWFKGQACKPDQYPPDTNQKKQYLRDFFNKNKPQSVADKMHSFLQDAARQNPDIKSWGIFGCCWGGAVVLRVLQTENGNKSFAAAAVVYPDMLDPSLAKGIQVPLALLASKDEKATDVTSFADKLLEPKCVETFDDQPHGWMAGRACLQVNGEYSREHSRGYQTVLDFWEKKWI